MDLSKVIKLWANEKSLSFLSSGECREIMIASLLVAENCRENDIDNGCWKSTSIYERGAEILKLPADSKLKRGGSEWPVSRNMDC